MCAIDDIDGHYDIWDIEEIKVCRTSHICSECRRTIEVGEPYTKTAGLGDGSWEHSKMCQHCRRISNWLEKNYDGWVAREIRSDFQEHRNLYTALSQWRAYAGLEKGWRRKNGSLLPLPQPEDLLFSDSVR